MNKLKKVFVFTIAISLSSTLLAQNIPLTKKERYKDFDYFCNIIEKVNPQLKARQNVTGVDIMKNIKTLRREIDTITNDTSYMQLLLRAIHIINDMHCIPIKG